MEYNNIIYLKSKLNIKIIQKLEKSKKQKKNVKKYLKRTKTLFFMNYNLSFKQKVICSVSAGIATVCLTTPFDVVKVHIQVYYKYI